MIPLYWYPPDPRLDDGIQSFLENAHGLPQAEGVETQEQLQFLKASCCCEVQGFLFSKPVPIEEVAATLLRLTKPRS
ncbi:hypothetical protein CKO36_07100 [Rhabdochromatium marinum]|nr:hypothetical protein [Rhabdochromatium marinum]